MLGKAERLRGRVEASEDDRSSMQTQGVLPTQSRANSLVQHGRGNILGMDSTPPRSQAPAGDAHHDNVVRVS
jgi:hypothetical protein